MSPQQTLRAACASIFLISFGAVARGELTQRWVRAYESGSAFAIAADEAGNVYVTGAADGGRTGDDIGTVKYDANGNLLWSRLYNGSGNGDDAGYDVAVDAAGNVYVTGASLSSDTGLDYTTLKYTANGALLWAALYDDPSALRDDQAAAVVVDDDGNVYVTGVSDGGRSGDDFATIKYDAAGNELWVSRYAREGALADGATSLAIDGDGNVIVVGSSRVLAGPEATTLKYDNDGAELWVRHQAVAHPGNNVNNDVVVDAAGNIYTAGQLFRGGSNWDIGTIKYSPSGALQWVRYYAGALDSVDTGTSIALDPVTGHLYVGGHTVQIAARQDYTTVSYTSGGVQRWARTYNGTGSADDLGLALAIDRLGRSFLTGWSWGGGLSSNDYATVGYTEDGADFAVERYNSPSNQAEVATDVVVDGGGNVIITGASEGNYVTIKYSPFPRCSSDERIKKARCKSKRSGNKLTVKLVGGADSDSFRVVIGNGDHVDGTLNAKGRGKAKFNNVPSGDAVATALFGCGAEVQEGYDCG